MCTNEKKVKKKRLLILKGKSDEKFKWREKKKIKKQKPIEKLLSRTKEDCKMSLQNGDKYSYLRYQLMVNCV